MLVGARVYGSSMGVVCGLSARVFRVGWSASVCWGSLVVSYWMRICGWALFRDKADGMRNVFRIGSEGVEGGLGPSRAWST